MVMKTIYSRFLFLIPFLFSFFHSPTLSAQQVTEGNTGFSAYSITREVKPPILNIVEGSLRFIDPGGNNIIDAGETCKLVFSMENTGLGDGIGLTIKVSATGSIQGVSFSPTRSLEV